MQFFTSYLRSEVNAKRTSTTAIGNLKRQEGVKWFGTARRIWGQGHSAYHRFVGFRFVISRLFGEHFYRCLLSGVLKAKRYPAIWKWVRCSEKQQSRLAATSDQQLSFSSATRFLR